MPYVCVGIGTGSPIQRALDENAVRAYALARDLEVQKDGSYVCVGLGTGDSATDDQAALEAIAKGLGREVEVRQTCC